MREGDIIQDGPWAGAEVISVYTRAQAIEDGVLVDLSQFGLPAEAGFKYPVACTSAVWALIEPTTREAEEGQSVNGRLWDVLMMLHFAIKRSRDDSDTTRFQTIFRMLGRARPGGQRTVTLKAIVGPGDDMEPVITIMLPEED
jgi:hypothetical protein